MVRTETLLTGEYERKGCKDYWQTEKFSHSVRVSENELSLAYHFSFKSNIFKPTDDWYRRDVTARKELTLKTNRSKLFHEEI